MERGCFEDLDNTKSIEMLILKLDEQSLDASKVLTGYGPWLRARVGQEDHRFLNLEKKRKDQREKKTETQIQYEEAQKREVTLMKPRNETP
uniref:Uncharacterized protein n=1 Tax=Nelumbo nucifera TaxID=4432 RepID=A0A822Z879_NELNU|nr:TPA_asm: hypothetical protein HUJ06_015380 [Nelumbo nucifera]